MKTNIKYKLFFLIFMIVFCCFNCFVNAEEYKEYELGDKIEYNGIDFYVIEKSEKTKDYVTLLKAEPLTVDEIIEYGTSEDGINYVNKYTATSVGTPYNLSGYGGIAYYSSEECSSVGFIENDTGCKADNAVSYDTSDIKHIVDAWGKDKLKDSDLIEDDLGYKIRLITKDEIVINFGYEKDVEVTSGRYNSNPETPNFIYGNKYSYWTMTPHEDSDSHLWYVSSAYQKGVLEPLFCNGTNGSYAPSYSAVRPVINLKKASETTKPSDRKKSITSKEFKIGDIVEYNGISFYAIENSDKAKNTVALLKAEPLTTTEVNKYGKGYINKDTETKEAIDHNGYGYIAYYSSDTCTDYSENPIGCTSEYDASDIKYVVDKWSNDVLQGLKLTEDKTGYKVRLITKEEIIDNLSFSVNSSGIYHASIDTPYWVYSEFYSYLTMSPADDSNSNVFTISSTMESSASRVHPSFGYTSFKGAVRPIIILDKGIDNKVIEKIEVPDTNLSASLIFGIIAAIIILVSFVPFYVGLKRRKAIK